MNHRRPPLLIRLLQRFVSGDLGEEWLESLAAGWDDRLGAGRVRAYRWLWRQVLSLHTVRLIFLLRRHRRGSGALTPKRAAYLADPLRWLRPIRYAARGLGRRPGFALVLVLTLALGIGANTAVFSVVDGVLLEPLPYPDAHRLVFVWGETSEDATVLLSGPQAAEAVEVESFSSVARVFGFGSTSMVREELPEPIRTLTVGPAFFDVLAVPPLLGRGFRPEDDVKLTNEQIRDPDFVRPIGAMVLSHSFWRDRFGGDPGVLGRVVGISGHRQEIVGVMPPGFRAHLPSALEENSPEDVWILSPFDQAAFPRDTRFVRVIGRLPEASRISQAQAALERLATWQRQTFPEDARDNFHLRASSLQEEAGATARGPLLLLMAAVGLVLLIACANTATLLLARGAERNTELGLRRALGAGKGQLAAIGLGESFLAAAVGGLAGVFLASFLTRFLARLAPPDLPRVDAIEVDGSVLLYTAVVTLGVALAAGILPAIQSLRQTALRPEMRHTGTRRHHRAGNVLVVTEVALAVILVTATGLLLRSMGRVISADPGFDPSGVFTWEAALTTPTHPTWASRVSYFQAMEGALLSLPGVRAAGVMNPIPFDGADRVEVRLGMEEGAPRIVADTRRTGPGALEALGIQKIRGRLFQWSDLEDFDRLFAVVDERFAEEAWPGEEALGKVISVVRREYGEASRVWDEWKRVEVVGVVETIRGRDLRTVDPPTVYLTYSQNMWGSPAFVTKADVPLTGTAVRRAAAEANPRPLLRYFSTLEAVAGDRVAALRFALTLIGVFAALGLTLAATGVYGLLAHTVGARERELYVRAALGAEQRRLVVYVLRLGLGITVPGIALGWLGALSLTRFLDALLYEVTPTDPLTFLTVAAFLGTVATLACWIPGRRAGRTDPAKALR